MTLSEYLKPLAVSQHMKVALLMLASEMFPRLYPITVCVGGEIKLYFRRAIYSWQIIVGIWNKNSVYLSYLTQIS